MAGFPRFVRLADWEQRLGDYLAGERDGEFSWGTRDCVLFASGAVAAMAGEDPAAAIRGRYATRIGALRKLHQEGAASVGELAGMRFEAAPPAFARRGDLVTTVGFGAGGIGALGVCVGRLAYFVGEEDGAPGLVGLPLSAWTGAWRVPFE